VSMAANASSVTTNSRTRSGYRISSFYARPIL